MSSPFQPYQGVDLDHFNLDDMPITRSQTQIPHQRPGRNFRGRGHARTQAPPPPVAPIRGYTGLQYDTQNLSPNTARRAIDGLESDFLVDRVQSHGSGLERYYAFQLKAPFAVRVHNPAAGQSRVECTCEDFRSNRHTCAHIFWLFVGLHAVLINQQAADARSSTQIEVISRISALYPLIEARQGSLPQELNSVRGDETGSDSDDSAVGYISNAQQLENRTDTLCDILSTFDGRYMPIEYKHEFVDNSGPILSFGSVLEPGNLSLTIYRLAMWDEAFFKRLTQIVPRDVCARRYYDKQHHRVQLTLYWLTQYAQRGPQKGPQRDNLPERLRDMDVPRCAMTLRSIVHQICTDHDSRTAIAPLSASANSRLVVILSEIIGEVCTYNKDIYEGNAWDRARPPNEPARNRNLFAYLIGNPPLDPSLPLWMRDYFVIDRFPEMPNIDRKHLFERLATVKDNVDKMQGNDTPASRAYITRIDSMLHGHIATADEPSSSTAQGLRRL